MAHLSFSGCLAALCLSCATAAVLSHPHAHADPPPDTPNGEAAAHAEFDAGRRAYDHGSFSDALAHFERAYELSKRAELLYNIARAADSEGLLERAAGAYSAYLDALPDAENRDFVQARLTRMRALQQLPSVAADRTAASPEESARTGESGDYRQLVDEAVREFFGKNYEEARSLFIRAHALFPNARTHRGIGMTEFELRNYPAAIEHLERALSSAVRPLDSKLRSDVEELLARARNFVGRLVIEARPAATEVHVDGTPVDRFDANTPLVLKMGEHLIEARADGYSPERRHVNINGGEQQTLTIVFAHPLRSSPERNESRRLVKNPWLWAGVGVVTAAAAIGVAVAASRGDKRPTYDHGSWDVLGTAP